MPRRPRRQESVATALQGGRPQRGIVRLLRRGPVALGRGAIDGLFLGPLGRLIWRVLRSRSARRGCVAARRARSAWIDDPEPAGDPLLRRGVARADSAIQAMLAPERRGLAVVRNLPQRALSLVRQFLQLVRGLIPGFFLRLLLPRQPDQGQPPPPQQPPHQPKPPHHGAFAALYRDYRLRRHAPASPTPTPSSYPPPPPPPRPEPHTVDGEIVPDEEVIGYANYCKAAKVCPANSTQCHLCSFEIQLSQDGIVRTNDMIWHCNYSHEERSVMCRKVGCMVKVRSARDLARHTHFCHTLPTDWWQKYVWR